MKNSDIIVRGRSLMNRWWLLRKEDHLLLVTHFFYMQEQYRFFYQDLQAVIARKSRTYKAALALGLSVLSIILLAIVFDKSGAFVWTCAIITSLFLLLHVSLGPSYRLHIVTRVQNRKVKGTLRQRSWRRLRETILREINESQGQFSIEALKQYSSTSVHPQHSNDNGISEQAVAPEMQEPPTT